MLFEITNGKPTRLKWFYLLSIRGQTLLLDSASPAKVLTKNNGLSQVFFFFETLFFHSKITAQIFRNQS